MKVYTLLSLHGGQWLACVIVNLIALGMAVVISLGAAPVARAVFLHRHAGRLIGSLGGPPSVGEFTLTIALTAAVTVFFSTVGIGLGLLFRRALAPALLFIAWNTMCPMLGRWDPRSLWSSLGHRVFRFDGVFTLSDVPLTSPAAAVPVLLALPVLIVAAGHLTALRVSRFSTS